uniref:Putative Dihydroorotase-like protein (Aspartate carbamoyltransferase 44 kDa Non-catalytic chain) PyrC n=1 Tax=mine drainage metagenome TaxID=410659 RepID=E6QWY6_9ZZZZ
MKIQIKQGRIIDPQSGLDQVGDLCIAAGKVLAIGETPEGFHPNKVIEASGLVVCPGLIDLAVRLREPGNEYRATLESELLAACAGGVTSLSCPPDTEPPLDETGLVEMLKFRAKNLNLAKVYPIGALTQKLAGERLTEMAELRDAGCVGFSQADAAITDTHVLMRALEYAATFGMTVWLRPQDACLARGGVAHDGVVAARLGLPAVPPTAETIAVMTALLLVRDTGARVHLCRLSSAAAIDMVREAKAQGLPVSCDVSTQHLHLSEMDIGYFDPNCHLIPPLRSLRDRDAIRLALAEGVIDALCSDHTPVDDDTKQLPFGETEPGAAGVELLLPLNLKWAEEKALTLVEALASITCGPARVLGLDAGRIALGLAADICVFDPDAWWRVESGALKSLGKNSPFMGYEVRGKVRYTLVDGQLVFEQHEACTSSYNSRK